MTLDKAALLKRRLGEGEHEIDGKQALVLNWTETGGPAVTQNDRQGFGSRLILQVLPRELRGTAELAFHPAGVVFTMTTTMEAVNDRPVAAEG